MKSARFLCVVLLLTLSSTTQADGLIPLAGAYFDNINDGGITLGVANLDERHEWSTDGYYADATYNRYARGLSMGVASTGEWGLFRGGFAFMQRVGNGLHQNYLGLSFTYSTYQFISFKFALLSQAGNPADVRPMIAIGFGM